MSLTQQRGRSGNAYEFASAQFSAAQLQSAWQILQQSIGAILRGHASSLSFEELYRHSYNLVLHKSGGLLYNGVLECISDHLANSVRPELLRVLKQHEQHSNSNGVLQCVAAAFALHVVHMGLIRDILMYLDKQYVKQHNDMQPVYDAGLLLWKSVIVEQPFVLQTLRHVLLLSLDQERRGAIDIDRSLVKQCVTLLITASIGSLTFYQLEFEAAMLQRLRSFYADSCALFVATHTVSEFVQHTQQQIDEEEERCERYMHTATTKPKLRAVLHDVCIVAYAKQLVADHNSGCSVLFEQQQHQQLLRMYHLFARAHCLSVIKDHLFSYIKQQGLNIINAHDSNRPQQLLQQQHAQSALDPHTFVQQLLALKQQFNVIVVVSFCSDPLFVRSLKDAIDAVVNIDRRTSQLLALFVDDLFRRRQRVMLYDDVEAELTSLISLFTHIHDKDVFEDKHKQLMMNRMLTHSSNITTAAAAPPKAKTNNKSTLSASSSNHSISNSNNSSTTYQHDLERLMISKLKAECGYQFTSRLEGMFKDIQISKAVSAGWQQHEQQQQQQRQKNPRQQQQFNHVDLYVNVLTTGFWPIQQQQQPLPSSSPSSSPVLGPVTAMSLHSSNSTGSSNAVRDKASKSAAAPLALHATHASSDTATATAAVAHSNCNNILLPPVLQQLTQDFESFYLQQHSGRRLNWQVELSSAELRMILPAAVTTSAAPTPQASVNSSTRAAAQAAVAAPATVNKELSVTGYQLVILLLFNDRLSYTYSELSALTGIPHAELQRHLLSLAHPVTGRVLKKQPNTRHNEPHHVYTVNLAFTSQFYRNSVKLLSKVSAATAATASGDADNNSSIKISQEFSQMDSAVASAAAAGDHHQHHSLSSQLTESRKHTLEAAVVRIMKARKTLEHSALVLEVLRQCVHTFVVDAAVVKARIENLIEREYLQRDPNNRRIYHYLA